VLKVANQIRAGGASTATMSPASGAGTRGVRQTSPPSAGAASASAIPAPDDRLMERVRERCGAAIFQATALSSVPPEFLAALVANESAGVATAARFEPAVYRHLAELSQGSRRAYGSVSAPSLEAEVADLLHPKAPSFHERYLDAGFSSLAAPALAHSSEEALRELATSWGYTQIMGYHLIGRAGPDKIEAGTVQDLLDPEFHFRLALTLLAEFAAHFELNLAVEFHEMFCCWNTGRPDGSTFDPDYITKGLARMAIYRRIAAQKNQPAQAGSQKTA
jgi:hypothetical protein